MNEKGKNEAGGGGKASPSFDDPVGFTQIVSEVGSHQRETEHCNVHTTLLQGHLYGFRYKIWHYYKCITYYNKQWTRHANTHTHTHSDIQLHYKHIPFSSAILLINRWQINCRLAQNFFFKCLTFFLPIFKFVLCSLFLLFCFQSRDRAGKAETRS